MKKKNLVSLFITAYCAIMYLLSSGAFCMESSQSLKRMEGFKPPQQIFVVGQELIPDANFFEKLIGIARQIQVTRQQTQLVIQNARNLVLYPELGECINLQELVINYENLKTIPPMIFQLTHLTDLLIWSKALGYIDSEIGNLTVLKTIDFGKCALRSLPDVFSTLPSLTRVYLYNNQFDTFPIPLLLMKNLTTIDLSNNSITNIPDAIGVLENLETLNMSHCCINAISDNLFSLEKINELNLSGNKIEKLSLKVANLKNLNALYFSNNSYLGMESVDTFSKDGTFQNFVQYPKYLYQFMFLKNDCIPLLIPLLIPDIMEHIRDYWISRICQEGGFYKYFQYRPILTTEFSSFMIFQDAIDLRRRYDNLYNIVITRNQIEDLRKKMRRLNSVNNYEEFNDLEKQFTAKCIGASRLKSVYIQNEYFEIQNHILKISSMANKLLGGLDKGHKNHDWIDSLIDAMRVLSIKMEEMIKDMRILSIEMEEMIEREELCSSLF